MDNTGRIGARISLAHAEHNFREISRFTNGAKIIAVVKADAYGHGARTLAALYQRLGAACLAVACLSEALELRESGITCPILVLGRTPPENAKVLLENSISQIVFNTAYARELSEAAVAVGGAVSVHIKLDTGMTRLGFCAHRSTEESAAAEVAEVCALSGLSADGIFTHFADAENDDLSFTDEQFESFSKTVSLLAARGITFTFCHCANSAAVLNYSKSHLNCVRPGLLLYGIYPDGLEKCEIDLLPVMTLHSKIIDVRDVRAGDTVSYGRTFKAERDMTVAVVSAGYADGVHRSLSNRAQFLVHGRRVPILGRICMDLLMLDVSDIPDVRTGDEVVLFGEQGGVVISVGELADIAGTISYELFTSVSRRVTRTYTPENA